MTPLCLKHGMQVTAWGHEKISEELKKIERTSENEDVACCCSEELGMLWCCSLHKG